MRLLGRAGASKSARRQRSHVYVWGAFPVPICEADAQVFVCAPARARCVLAPCLGGKANAWGNRKQDKAQRRLLLRVLLRCRVNFEATRFCVRYFGRGVLLPFCSGAGRSKNAKRNLLGVGAESIGLEPQLFWQRARPIVLKSKGCGRRGRAAIEIFGRPAACAQESRENSQSKMLL